MMELCDYEIHFVQGTTRRVCVVTAASAKGAQWAFREMREAYFWMEFDRVKAGIEVELKKRHVPPWMIAEKVEAAAERLKTKWLGDVIAVKHTGPAERRIGA